jgi:hypothetical protein
MSSDTDIENDLLEQEFAKWQAKKESLMSAFVVRAFAGKCMVS